MITAVRRKSDGYLADTQKIVGKFKTSESVIQVRINNAISEAGGEADDWELIEIDPEVWQSYNPRCKHYLVVEDGETRLYQSDPEPELEAEVEPVDVMEKIRDLEAQIAALKSQVEVKAE